MDTNEKKQATEAPFALALDFFLKREDRWGAATAFAKQVGISQGYISELAAGKKGGREEKRRLIAKACGLTYEQFLEVGRYILEGADGELALKIVQAKIAEGGLAAPYRDVGGSALSVAQPGVNSCTVVNGPGNVAQNGGNNGERIAGEETPAANGKAWDGLLHEHVTQNPNGPQLPQSAPSSDAWSVPDYVAVPKIVARLKGEKNFIVDESEGPHYLRTEWLNRVCRHYTQALLLDWEDDSMEPAIRDGDTVILDASKDAHEIKEGRIYALGVDGVIMVKRLRRTPDGLVRIISDNALAYPEEPPVPPQKINILGRVVWRGGALK